MAGVPIGSISDIKLRRTVKKSDRVPHVHDL